MDLYNGIPGTESFPSFDKSSFTKVGGSVEEMRVFFLTARPTETIAHILVFTLLHKIYCTISDVFILFDRTQEYDWLTVVFDWQAERLIEGSVWLTGRDL